MFRRRSGAKEILLEPTPEYWEVSCRARYGAPDLLMALAEILPPGPGPRSADCGCHREAPGVGAIRSKGVGAALLNRALHNLGIPNTEVVVVAGMAAADANPAIEVERVPGVDRARLASEFQRYFENRVRGRWRDHTVGDLAARSCKVTLARPTTLIWFALDGCVAYLASSADDTAAEAMAVALMEALRG